MERGLADTRQKAQAMILAGEVLVKEQKAEKAGTLVQADASLRLLGGGIRYVSRGGLKLEGALREFKVSPQGRICLDVGASTGGFTDCLLQHGGARVYAVDVGYGQLAWSLRNDDRVVVFERTNCRNLTADILYAGENCRADLAVIDVSFISVAKILPAVLNLLTESPEIVCLIKPQFEAGRSQVGKGGVVRQPEIHREVIESLVSKAGELGLQPKGLSFSPLTGPKGNIEFLIQWVKEPQSKGPDIDAVVESAHAKLSSSKDA